MPGDIPTWSTDSLLHIRENLLKGLDKIAEHIENGTLDVGDPEKKINPPRSGGQLTLMLLVRVNNELSERGIDPKW